MTTFQKQLMSALAEGPDGSPIPQSKLVYLRERLKGRFFDFLLERFEEAQANGLTQAKLARRIGKSPEVVNRWLVGPSNLTLESASDLLAGIKAEELNMSASSLLNRTPANYWHDTDVSVLHRNLEPASATSSKSAVLKFDTAIQP